MTTKTVAYLRVSTNKQADKGLSLDVQREKVQVYASLYDLELVDIIVDAGESAKTLNRTGLQTALTMLENGKAQALLVVKLDRLTRSVADLGRVIETYFTPGKAALMSVSEQIDTRTAGGRLVLNILASVSQWERETLAERTSDAMRYKKTLGEFTGGEPPYGYSVSDKMLVPNDAEQEVIRQAKELRAAGLSLDKVAKELDKRGIQARTGKRFAAQQIKRLCA